jgi:MFS family permease
MHSRLADFFGYLLLKRYLITVTLIFSQTCTNSLIAGVGGGGLVGLTYVIVTDMVSLRERGKWMAIIVLQWAVGSVSGPVIGMFDSRSTLLLSTPEYFLRVYDSGSVVSALNSIYLGNTDSKM